MKEIINQLKNMKNVFFFSEREHLFKELFDKEAKTILIGFKENNKKIAFDIFFSRELVEIKMILPHTKEFYYKEFIEQDFNKVVPFVEKIQKKYCA